VPTVEQGIEVNRLGFISSAIPVMSGCSMTLAAARVAGRLWKA
jgi:hypothetical protein